MKITTRFCIKPIPIRSCDWSAIDADTYDAGEPVGFGATEQQAVADLLHQLASV